MNCVERRIRLAVSTMGAMGGDMSPEHAARERDSYPYQSSPILGSRAHISKRSGASVSASQHSGGEMESACKFANLIRVANESSLIS